MSKKTDLIQLEAALAETNANLAGLSTSDLGAADKVIWRRYYEHQRRKILLRVQLCRQEEEIKSREWEYKVSQTPGAAKHYRRRLQMLNQSRALGRSGDVSLPPPPEVAAKAALGNARAQHAETLRLLQECSNGDGDFKHLVKGTSLPQLSVPHKHVPHAPVDAFDEFAGKLMAMARPLRSTSGRLPTAELEKILQRLDQAGFKPEEHFGRKFREQLMDWNQKHARSTGAVKTFVAAYAKPPLRRGVMKCLFDIEKKYQKKLSMK